MDRYLLENIEAKFWASQITNQGKDTSLEEIKEFNDKIGDGKNLSPENEIGFINYMRNKLNIPVNTLFEIWVNKCRELL